MNDKLKYFIIGFMTSTFCFLLIILLLVIVSLNKKEEVDNSIGTFNCDLGELKYTFDNTTIINNGNLYEINIKQKYSDNTNCRKISDKVIKKAIDNYYIGEDNKVYIYNDSNLTETEVNGKIPSELLKDEVIMAYEYSDNNYYVLKDDGKIYKYKFDRKYAFSNGKGTYSYTLTSSDLFLEYINENIKSFKVSNGEINYVLTDQNVYKRRAINVECLEYADIECIYELGAIYVDITEAKFVNLFGDTIVYVNPNNLMYGFTN